MNYLLLTLTAVLFLFGCKKEVVIVDDTGAIINKEYIWKKALTDNQWIWSGPIQLPIFQEKYITASHFEANAKLEALDIFTGESIWAWDDYMGTDLDSVFLSMYWPYVHDNLLVFQKGPRSYCIDMSIGATVWKTEAGHPFHTYLGGTGAEFLSKRVVGDTMGYEIEYDFVGDIYTGSRYSLPHPEFEILDNSGKIGIRSTRGNLFEANGKQYFLSTYVKFSEHWVASPFLGLYNRTDLHWEYAEKQILPKHIRNTAANFPIISNDIVVTSIGNHMCANDLWTGDRLWVYDCGGGFDTGGFFIHENRIYTLAKSGGLYCLDLFSGNVIWHQTREKIGFGSKMVHLNGVIYTAHGKLVAIDMANGNFIWNITSPDGEGFKEVAVYPGKTGQKPLVLTATYQNAYCFEAAK